MRRVAPGVRHDLRSAPVVNVPRVKAFEHEPERHDTVVLAAVTGAELLFQLVAFERLHFLDKKRRTYLYLAVPERLDDHFDHGGAEVEVREHTHFLSFREVRAPVVYLPVVPHVEVGPVHQAQDVLDHVAFAFALDAHARLLGLAVAALDAVPCADS